MQCFITLFYSIYRRSYNFLFKDSEIRGAMNASGRSVDLIPTRILSRLYPPHYYWRSQIVLPSAVPALRL